MLPYRPYLLCKHSFWVLCDLLDERLNILRAGRNEYKLNFMDFIKSCVPEYRTAYHASYSEEYHNP